MPAAIRHKTYGLHPIKFGLLLFWGLWFLIAFLTNTFDFLGVYNYLPTVWRFRSNNLALITSVIHIYNFPGTWANLLFTIDIIIQGSASILFLIAAMKWWSHRQAWKWINGAFGLSIALWAAFILMDEFFIAYNFEGTHMLLIVAELLTFTALHLLPDESN